jgi:hypothetical protein
MSDMPLRWRAAPKVEEEFALVVQSKADFGTDVRQSSAQTIARRAADDACAKARRAKARELDGRGVRSRNIDAPPVKPEVGKESAGRVLLQGGSTN